MDVRSYFTTKADLIALNGEELATKYHLKETFMTSVNNILTILDAEDLLFAKPSLRGTITDFISYNRWNFYGSSDKENVLKINELLEIVIDSKKATDEEAIERMDDYIDQEIKIKRLPKLLDSDYVKDLIIKDNDNYKKIRSKHYYQLLDGDIISTLATLNTMIYLGEGLDNNIIENMEEILDMIDVMYDEYKSETGDLPFLTNIIGNVYLKKYIKVTRENFDKLEEKNKKIKYLKRT